MQIMQVFKIGPEGIKKIKNKLLIRILPILLIGVTVGFFIGTANSKGKASSTDLLPFLVPLYGIIIFVSLYRALKRQKTLLESYTLTFSDNLITRIQLNTPEISINLNDIKAIGTLKDGSLMIKGNNSKDFICIPSYIDGFAEIHQRLQQVRPIDINNKLPFWLKYQILLSVLTMGLMVCVFVVNNKWVVALSGSLFIALMTWSLIEIRGNKNVDIKTKRSAWWVIVVMLAVIVGMIMKLSV